MKTMALSLILLVVASGLLATDFTFQDNSTLRGNLRGIRANAMYILDYQNRLTIVSMTDILSILENGTNVTDTWKRRAPFMDINAEEYYVPSSSLTPAAVVGQRVIASQVAYTNSRAIPPTDQQLIAQNLRAIRKYQAIQTYTILGWSALSIGSIIYYFSKAKDL